MSGARMRKTKNIYNTNKGMKAVAKKQESEQPKKSTINTLPLYILLLIALVAYVLGQEIQIVALFSGALAVILIVILLFLELSTSFKETGYRKNIIEIVTTVLFVIILWYAMRIVLNTSNPIDVVPSCSMLPALQRGDLVVLQGLGSNINSIKAPMVDVTSSAAVNLTKNLNKESLECVAYKTEGSRAYISQFVGQGYNIGLYSAYSGYIVPNSSQAGNLIKYACGVQQVKYDNGTILNEAYTSSISVLNKTISGDANNSVAVYETVPQDSFYKEGDSFIVHRIYAVLNASGNYYFLTKGDNNPGLDIQYSNAPPNFSQISGKVVADIPYLGYFKLLLSGTPTPPAGCNSTVLN